MLALSRLARILCGLAPLLLFGCYSPPYHSGYGYGSPYGTPSGPYNQPPGTYPPGTYPPGTYPGTSPAPNDGNLGTPGKVGGSNGTGSGAPTPAVGNGQSNSGGKLVPNYNDPNNIGGGKTTDAGGNANGGVPSKTGSTGNSAPDKGGSPFSSDGAFNAEASGDKVKLTGGKQPPTTPIPSGAPEPKRFQPPKDVGKLPDATTTPLINDAKTPAAPSPYDYDKEKYTWLRGRLDFDATSRSWQLMYSLNGEDQYGGVLTLNDDPRLKKLRSGDVVLVEGVVDATQKDARAKPRYKISDLFGPLVPKSQLGNSQPVKSGDSQASNENPNGTPGFARIPPR